jgi:hypothetical protein
MRNDAVDDEAIVQRYRDAIPRPDTSYRARLRASLAAQSELPRSSRRWPALSAAVTAAVVAASVLASVWPHAATPVSARLLLQRAMRAATSPLPLRGTSETTYIQPPPDAPPGAGGDLGAHWITSSWAFRDGTHFWLETTTHEPALETGTSVLVANRSSTLWYSSQRGVAYRIKGLDGTFVIGVAQSGNILPGALIGRDLDRYNTPSAGDHARVIRQALLLGRQTYVLKVWPAARQYPNCSGARQCLKRSRAYGYALYWIDKDTSIILRAEEHGVPGRLGGREDFLYRVTSIRFGSGATRAQLRYVPPVLVHDVPRWTLRGAGGTADWAAPPGFVVAGPPGLLFTLHNSRTVRDTAGTSEFSVLYSQGSRFVYVQEELRTGGLPAALKAGQQVQAGTCTAWTGRYPDGHPWAAFARGRISILLVSTGFSPSRLVRYAGQVCAAPIARPSR